MAIDKDPSIYRDRGMIGSSEELDEYGVWVKSEPEDLASAHESSAPIEEPTLPDIEDLPDLELDAEGDFDLSASAPDLNAGEEKEETVPAAKKEEEKTDFAIEESSSDFGEELPSFEDIDSFDAEIPPVSNEDFTELSMDDFLEPQTAEASGSGAEDEPLDIDLDFQDSTEPSQGPGETEDFDFQIEEETSAADEKSEGDISLESVSDFDDFLNDLSDTETPSKDSSTGSTSDEPSAIDLEEEKAEVEDISIDVEESEPLTVAFEPVEESADIVLSGFGDSEGEEAGLSAQEESFDDVAALSRDLQEGESSPAADAGLSTQLLMRIADELSSIKTELSSLKEELSVLRGETKADVVEEKTAPASHGFFDEEDDEKIALTGDELDNILNTADFTEEAGADATADLSDESVIDDFLMDREDLLGEEGGTSVGEESAEMREAIEPTEEAFLDEPPAPVDDLDGADFGLPTDVDRSSEETIERIELDDEPAEPLPEELQKLQETGVIPMTEAPEDTSYLETDAESAISADELETPTDDLGASDIDLTEAVIDEPDLGGAIFEEAPIEEPAIDAIHLDLDMEESLDVEGDEQETEEGEGAFENIELTLDEYVGEEAQETEAFGPETEITEDEGSAEPEAMPAPEESFAEVVPEGFVVEPEETQEPIIGEEEQTEPIETVDLAEEPQEEESQPLPVDIRQEVRAVLSYMDQLLESLPEDKIEEFAKSEYFDTYKKLFEELGLV